MSTHISTTIDVDAGKHWRTDGLRRGFTVDLVVYGERMSGQVLHFRQDTITVRVPRADQPPGLQLYTAYGTAVISLDHGAANVPVSVRALNDEVRLQVVGAAEYVQRRMHKRIAIELPVTLCWPGDVPGSWELAESKTVDISVGGVRVASTMTVWPSIDAEITLSLRLPGQTATMKAVAVGKTPDYGLRLRFTDIAPDVVKRLEAIVG